MFPKKEIALQIPYDTLRSVKITEVEKTLNYEVSFTTDTDTIRLSVHKKEWSEFRTSGTVATGNTFLNVGGFAATKSWKSINWHRQNLDNTFSYLQNLPQSAKPAETVNSNMTPLRAAADSFACPCRWGIKRAAAKMPPPFLSISVHYDISSYIAVKCTLSDFP